MSHKTTLPILIALILAHMVLAAAYMLQTPYRTAGVVLSSGKAQDIGAPDERQHANYIDRLLHRRGFPVFDPKDPNLYENYQSHQPPAYYTLAAGWAEVFGVTSVNTKEEGWILRSLNILIGGIGVAGVFFLAIWGYRRERLALTAAAIAALLPMNLALSGAISNDPLLICLCTWVLALLARVVRGHWSLKRAVAIGLLMGIALLTKTTAVALIPVVLLALYFHRPRWQYAAVMGVLALGLVLPWWIRNTNLYGDPFAMKAFTEAFGGSAQKSTFINQFIPHANPGKWPEYAYWVDWVLFWTARSFLGVFGYMDIWLTQSGYAKSTIDENRLYWVAIFLFLVGFVGWGLSWRDDRFKHAINVRWMNLAFFVIVVALFLRFNSTYFQAQARYVLPALGPIAVGLAAGYRELAKNYKKVPLVAVVAFLLVVNVFALVRLGPQFAQRISLGGEASSTGH